MATELTSTVDTTLEIEPKHTAKSQGSAAYQYRGLDTVRIYIHATIEAIATLQLWQKHQFQLKTEAQSLQRKCLEAVRSDGANLNQWCMITSDALSSIIETGHVTILPHKVGTDWRIDLKPEISLDRSNASNILFGPQERTRNIPSSKLQELLNAALSSSHIIKIPCLVWPQTLATT